MYIFLFSALRIVTLILIIVAIRSVRKNKAAGVGNFKQYVSALRKTILNIPVVGTLFKIIGKILKVTYRIIKSALRQMSTWPIIRTVVAVIRKLYREICQIGKKIIAWSETE